MQHLTHIKDAFLQELLFQTFVSNSSESFLINITRTFKCTVRSSHDNSLQAQLRKTLLKIFDQTTAGRMYFADDIFLSQVISGRHRLRGQFTTLTYMEATACSPWTNGAETTKPRIP